MFNTLSVPTDISYKSFRTWNLPTKNSYCDHSLIGPLSTQENKDGIGLDSFPSCIIKVENTPHLYGA